MLSVVRLVYQLLASPVVSCVCFPLKEPIVIWPVKNALCVDNTPPRITRCPADRTVTANPATANDPALEWTADYGNELTYVEDYLAFVSAAVSAVYATLIYDVCR
jgi:hypothetical protein